MSLISLIVAMTPDRVIGKDNALPWRIPGDMKYFKKLTMGKPLIMGRKTFQSLPGGPLPGRTNIVLTRDKALKHEGCLVAHDVQEALALAQGPEVMVIGGAEIYAQALPLAQRLYITEVLAEVAGDAWFPDFDRTAWREVSREDHKAKGGVPAHAYVVLERAYTKGR